MEIRHTETNYSDKIKYRIKENRKWPTLVHMKETDAQSCTNHRKLAYVFLVIIFSTE